jgi:cob(I)alamin adenosyltransferase
MRGVAGYMADEKSCRPQHGLVIVFTGNGKGKTTAAIGTAVRSAGYGLRVYIVFFMKGKMFSQGEVNALANLPNIETAAFGQYGWVSRNSDNSEAREQALAALIRSRDIISGGKHDLVVLDEINSAVDFGLISLEEVIDIVKKKPWNMDLILTGRNAHADIVRMADTVTEMVNIKHAFENGIEARKGIDY